MACRVNHSEMYRCVQHLISLRTIHIERRLKELGHSLPPLPPEPRGNYNTYIVNGNMVYLSGHLPQEAGGKLLIGRLGENMNIEQGQEAAKLAGLQMLASLKAACSDLDNVKKVIKVTGFVSSTNEFTSQAVVMNGCSDLMGEVFGLDIGRHSRSAIGVNVLPLGIPVEVEGIFEIELSSAKI